MEFDDQMRRFFGTDDLGAVSPAGWPAASSACRSSSVSRPTRAAGSRCGRCSTCWVRRRTSMSPSRTSATAMRRARSWTCSTKQTAWRPWVPSPVPPAQRPSACGQGRSGPRAPCAFGIVGRDHRIVCRQVPARAVFCRSHAMVGAEVALEHLHLHAAIEAGHGVGLDRRADRDRRRALFLDRLGGLTERGQRSIDRLDQARQIAGRDRIVADMGGDDVGNVVQQGFIGHDRHASSNWRCRTLWVPARNCQFMGAHSRAP
jgi:hypothetical protein